MQPRLKRYREFIEEQYVPSLLWNEDYSLERLSEKIKVAAKAGKYKKIIFTGMGCSAIVSDVLKGFFTTAGLSVYVEVINDYDIDYVLDKEGLKRGDTLVVISSYSGYSQEPIHAYHKIKKYTDNIVFLTSGGELERIADEEQIALIRWVLRQPDREYPLFHVPQYFGILLDIFYKLGIIDSNYFAELKRTSEFLSAFPQKKVGEAEALAKQLRDHNIIFVASPKWHLSLLKLADMHINEMSMTPAHRHYLHEFTHSEVATLSNPKTPQAVVVLRDDEDDEYTQRKIQNLQQLLTAPVQENKNIAFAPIDVEGKNFFEKFFSTLLFIQHVALSLGEYYDVSSRELISQAAGNPWYNQETIRNEQKP